MTHPKSDAGKLEPPSAGVLENPMWDLVETMPQDPFSAFDGRWAPASYPTLTGLLSEVPAEEQARLDAMPSRHTLARRYTWALPAPAALDWLAAMLDGRSVVEMGAGTGYWAWMLTQRGIDVIAYDAAPPALEGACNGWHDPHQYHPVLQAEVDALTAHADRALFLCWPPRDSPMAYQALRHYAGDTVIYIGEPGGGTTGDAAFHDALEQDWDRRDRCPDFVVWGGMRDTLTVYRRSAS